MSDLYTPPAVFKKLHPAIGADFVFTFRDGLVLFHSSVLKRFSERLRPAIEKRDAKLPPHNMDIRSHERIVGHIIKTLLYNGEMFADIDPAKSSLSAKKRIHYIQQAHSVCYNLGLTCLHSTLESWIAREVDQSADVESQPPTSPSETEGSQSELPGSESSQNPSNSMDLDCPNSQEDSPIDNGNEPQTDNGGKGQVRGRPKVISVPIAARIEGRIHSEVNNNESPLDSSLHNRVERMQLESVVISGEAKDAEEVGSEVQIVPPQQVSVGFE